MGCLSRSLLASAIVLSLVFHTEGGVPDDQKTLTDHQEYKNKRFAVTTDKSNSKGKCEQGIAIKSSGVDDTFTEECVNDLETLSTDDFIVVGNPMTNPYSLLCFSDTDNIVVMVRDGKCTMNLYHKTDDGKLAGITSDIEAVVCEDLKEKVNKKMVAKKKAGGVYEEPEQDIVVSGNEKEDTRSKYEVTTGSFDRKGKCIQEIKIKGNGVEDTFTGPCVDDLEVVNTNDVLIIGEPEKTPFCLFSDSPAILVVLKDGKCTKRSYTTVSGKTTQLPATVMDTKECDKIKEKIKNELAKNKKTKAGDNKDEKYDITTGSFERRGKCIQEIKIKGKGVEDIFREACVDNLEVVNTKDVLVIGDPEKTPFCFFSDSPATLVVLKDGQCTKKSYSTVNGKISSTSSELDIDECDKLEDKIKKELEKKRKADKENQNKKGCVQFSINTETLERRGKCLKKISIEGNGVKDSFTGACEANVEVISSKCVLVVGDLEKSPFTLFSDKPEILVFIKDGLCTKKIYTNVDGKVKPSSSFMDESECDEIEEKIKSEIEKKKKTQTGDNNGTDRYDVTTNSFERNKRCIQEIKIKGKGIEDTFKGPCVENLETVKSKDFLIIGDLDKTPFCLFSDKPGILVILKDGQCKQKSYTSANPAGSSTVLDDDQCQEIEDKIEKELKKKGTNNKGANLYAVSINENTVKGRCAKEIKIKGNGVEDFFKTDCEDLDVSNSNNILRIGDPLVVPFFCLYSDEPSALVVIEDEQCRKKQYKTANGRTKVKSSLIMDEEECGEIMKRIRDMKKKKNNKGGLGGRGRNSRT